MLFILLFLVVRKFARANKMYTENVCMHVCMYEGSRMKCMDTEGKERRRLIRVIFVFELMRARVCERVLQNLNFTRNANVVMRLVK